MTKSMRVLLAVGLLVAAGAARADSINLAASLRWQGWIDTDLAFSSFFGADHTVAFRFLPQYAMTAEAPVLSVNGGGSYVVGLGGFRAGGKNAVKLLVRIGGSSAFYSLGAPAHDGDPIPLEHAWHTLAVARKGGTFTLFLDGKHLQKDGGGDLAPAAADLTSPSGTLRLGRESSTDAQFYGLVDDVVVLRGALDESQVKALFAQPRIDRSSVAGMLTQGWTFDSALPSGAALPSRLAHAPTYQGSAFPALVSQDRDLSVDLLFLPPPYQKAKLRLPFEAGVTWQVEQPYEGLASHNDYAAFSLDFVRNDPNLPVPIPNPLTCGTKVVAAASGTILNGCDLGDPPVVHGAPDLTKGCAQNAMQFAQDGGPLIDGYDWIRVQAKPDANYTYEHPLKGSLREALPADAAQFHSPAVTGPPATARVERGQWIGRAGTRGVNNCHLHFSTGNSDMSFPVAFDEYELFEGGHFVAAIDAPKVGQIVRVPKQPKPPLPTPATCAAWKTLIAQLEQQRQQLWSAIADPKTSAATRKTDARKAAALTSEIDGVQADAPPQTLSDVKNCGACGHACVGDARCAEGRCCAPCRCLDGFVPGGCLDAASCQHACGGHGR